MVLHTNHAKEFTKAASAACARIIRHGIPMLSQTVLLKNINDDAASLTGAAGAQVDAFCGAAEDWVNRYPDAADVKAGNIL